MTPESLPDNKDMCVGSRSVTGSRHSARLLTEVEEDLFLKADDLGVLFFALEFRGFEPTTTPTPTCNAPAVISEEQISKSTTGMFTQLEIYLRDPI